MEPEERYAAEAPAPQRADMATHVGQVNYARRQLGKPVNG